MTNFNDLPWNDAELQEIIINRARNDVVQLRVKWPEYGGDQTAIIEFFDCYAFQGDMHFGVVPPDYIIEAACFQESSELKKIKSIWVEMGVDLSKLCCYQIKTNSTNSTIMIYALGFRVHTI